MPPLSAGSFDTNYPSKDVLKSLKNTFFLLVFNDEADEKDVTNSRINKRFCEHRGSGETGSGRHLDECRCRFTWRFIRVFSVHLCFLH